MADSSRESAQTEIFRMRPKPDDYGLSTCDPSSTQESDLRTAANLEPYIDAIEAARFLRVHPKTLMRLAREGSVSAYSFSDGTRRRWRFLKSELDRWMRSRVNSTSHPVRSVS